MAPNFFLKPFKIIFCRTNNPIFFKINKYLFVKINYIKQTKRNWAQLRKYKDFLDKIVELVLPILLTNLVSLIFYFFFFK